MLLHALTHKEVMKTYFLDISTIRKKKNQTRHWISCCVEYLKRSSQQFGYYLFTCIKIVLLVKMVVKLFSDTEKYLIYHLLKHR